MKKRIFSFIVMVITLFALIAFGVPNIKDNTKTGMEFNGGFDILYEINTDNADLSSSELVKMAAEGIEKRLDIANVIDPVVSIEGDKYVRVTVSSSSQIVSDEIRDVIETNAEISFRCYKDLLLATGDEILQDVGASLSSETDVNGNPVILLHIANTDKLAEITEHVAGLEDQHLVVWLGYEDGDAYANLQTDASVAKKIIYNATVSSKLNTDTITITGTFTKEAAQRTVDLINSGTLDYNLNVVQISTIEEDVAESTFNKVLMASLVAIVLVLIILSVYYKLGGLVSSIALIFNVFLTLTLFVTFKGVINQQAVAALIVSIGIAVDAVIILLERVKLELYNGKNLERALNEGYKKSVSSIVDTNIVSFIMSTVMFFFGSSVANFALMLSLSSVCTLVVMTVINKLLLTLLIKLNVTPKMVGANKAYLENKELYINSKVNNVNPLKNTKKHMLGAGVFASVAVTVMLVLQLTMGALFNYNNTVKEGCTISIVSENQYFINNDHILAFFGQEGLNIELKNIKTEEVELDNTTKYKVTVTTSKSISSVETELRNKVIEAYGENTEIKENYELYINDINPKSTLVSLLSTLYTVGVGVLVIGVYLAVRYRYSYAIAAIVSTITSIILTALFLGLTRIKIGSDAVIAIFAIATYGMSTLIVIFTRLKEMVVDKNKKYISNEERYEAVKKAVSVSLPRTIITTVSVVIISAVLLAFSSATNYSFYLTLIIGLMATSYSAILIAGNVWLLLERRSDKKKRVFKPKKKNPKFKDLEETTFIGIND